MRLPAAVRGARTGEGLKYEMGIVSRTMTLVMVGSPEHAG
jgi:hypothetical protein